MLCWFSITLQNFLWKGTQILASLMIHIHHRIIDIKSILGIHSCIFTQKRPFVILCQFYWSTLTMLKNRRLTPIQMHPVRQTHRPWTVLSFWIGQRIISTKYDSQSIRLENECLARNCVLQSMAVVDMNSGDVAMESRGTCLCGDVCVCVYVFYIHLGADLCVSLCVCLYPVCAYI